MLVSMGVEWVHASYSCTAGRVHPEVQLDELLEVEGRCLRHGTLRSLRQVSRISSNGMPRIQANQQFHTDLKDDTSVSRPCPSKPGSERRRAPSPSLQVYTGVGLCFHWFVLDDTYDAPPSVIEVFPLQIAIALEQGEGKSGQRQRCRQQVQAHHAN